MKIAITSTGPTLDDQVETRFGRCAYFIFVDPETMKFDAIENPNIAVGGGAGPQSAQLMASRNVSVVLTGNCGPNAFQTFGATGIRIITGVSGRVIEAVDQFKGGQLNESSAPSVQSHFGMGCRGGRGLGFSRGTGVYRGIRMISESGDAAPPETSRADPLPAQESLADLKHMANALRTQLEEFESRIRKLEKR